MRLIDADALKEHKFLTQQVKVIGGRHNGKLKEQLILTYQKGWNDCIDAIIDNAPTVELRIGRMTNGIVIPIDRPQGEWARHDEWVGGVYVGGFYHVNCTCEDGYYSKWETNFCPNCGQPMMKGEEE